MSSPVPLIGSASVVEAQAAAVSSPPAAPAAPELPVPVQAILLLAFAAFASALSVRVTDPMLPQLASEFGVALSSASLVVTVFAVAYGVSQLLFGPLGDRYGKYRVIAWACLASALTAASCGLAPNFETLVVARLLAGATAAAVIPLAIAWIGDVVPYATRQPVIARFLVGQIFGLSAGVLLGGLAADHLGRRVPFFGVAAMFVVIGLALLSLNRRLPARAKVATRSDGHVVQRTVAEFGAVLARPWARVVLITVFLEGIFLFGAFAFIATHLHRVFGLSLSAAGALVMSYGLGGLLFAGVSQTLVRRLGEVGMTACGAVLLSTSFFTIAWAPAWGWVPPACIAAGLGFYMLHNTMQTNASQMAPERRGAAVAAFASLFYLGQSVGVWAAGLLIGVTSTRFALVIGALGVLAVGTNFSRLRRRAAPLAGS